MLTTLIDPAEFLCTHKAQRLTAATPKSGFWRLNDGAEEQFFRLFVFGSESFHLLSRWPLRLP